jgi:hypothetical protein
MAAINRLAGFIGGMMMQNRQIAKGISYLNGLPIRDRLSS